MKQKIQIYVRQQSTGRNLLTLYVPAAMRERFVDGIARGIVEAGEADISLEVSVLPEWVTDKSDDMPHARIPISLIATTFTEN